MIKQTSTLITGEEFQWSPKFEASDLRVGNKVYKDFEKVCTVIGVIEDKNNSNESNVWTDNTKYGRNITEFYPIPLTPEILEKCGFVLDMGVGVWFDKKQYDDFGFTLWHKYSNEVNFRYTREAPSSTIEVLYLHQLQNLYFALTAEELEVNL